MPIVLNDSFCSSAFSQVNSKHRPSSTSIMPLPSFLRKKSRDGSDLSISSPQPTRRSSLKSSMPFSKSPFGSVFHSSATRRPGIYPASPTHSPRSNRSSVAPMNPYSDIPSEAPPEYTPVAPPSSTPSSSLSPPSASVPTTARLGASTAEDPFAFLSSFDTVFLIDDSGSMAGRSWRETAAALKSITPICTAHDADGIDIYFLNEPDNAQYRNITRPDEVDRVFSSVRPRGITPTGTRLQAILKPYLADLERKVTRKEEKKALNIIVITDGVPSDDPESVIIAAAKQLDKLDVPAWQVGIQFFQVGEETGAAEALKELDDGLVEMGGGIRDIVDTVPWTGESGIGLNGMGIMKVVLGAVTRRLDRKQNSAEWRPGFGKRVG